MIRVQRDYFIRSPIVQLIPSVGEIYNSDNFRFLLSNTQAINSCTVQNVADTFFVGHLP